MKKAYFLIVLFLCGLSIGNIFAAAPAAGRLGQELIKAAAGGHETIVKLLLQVDGIDVNAADEYKDTALIRAAERGHENIVKLLLQVEGIDVNTASQSGTTALMWTAYHGDKNIVKMLLDAGADKDLQTPHGHTAEDLARAAGNEDLANMIRDYGSGRLTKPARIR